MTHDATLTDRLRALLARGGTEIHLSAQDLAFCRCARELHVDLSEPPSAWIDDPDATDTIPSAVTRFTLHWFGNGSALAVLNC